MVDKGTFDIMKLVRPSIVNLKPYASAKEEFKDFDQDLIFMDANENPYENGLNRYPDPHQKELKQRIAEIREVDGHNIVLGNGSDEILDMIFRVFFEPGQDNIIINTPTFGMFEVLANLNNIACRKVSLDKQFHLQPDLILNAIDQNTKAVFICSPNNPTGNVMQEDAVEKLLNQNLLVVIDEAYIDFSQSESWVYRLSGHPNLIVTQTFSKAFGLAGIRLGACYASDMITELLKKVKMPYNVNVLTQRKALEVLSDQEKIKSQVEKIVSNRILLTEILEKIDLVEKIYPSESNFLLIKVRRADRVYNQLIAKNLVVRNRSKEPLCEDCLRITVGTDQENNLLVQALLHLNENIE